MAQRQLTRREMYELVWSMPLATIAATFQISDVALKKICDQHRVPTPSSAVWARKKAGQKVKQPLFHHTAEAGDELIVITPVTGNPLKDVKVPGTLRRRRVVLPAHVLAPIIQPLAQVHDAIAATAWALRSAMPDENGAVIAEGEGLCGVTVSADHAERAIHLLDGLARELDAHGLSLTPSGSAMEVKNGVDQIQLTLSERVQRTKHEPTSDELAAEKRRQKKRAYDANLGLASPYQGRGYPDFDFFRTGEMAFVVTSQSGYGGGRRGTWRDTRRQSLDTLLDSLAGGIVMYLDAAKLSREEHEKERRDEAIYWRREKLEQSWGERESERLKFVRRVVKDHREICDLRSVLDMCQTSPHVESGEALVRMLTWTEARLASLEKRITQRRLNARLEKQNLFPERDDIVEELEALPATSWAPDLEDLYGG